MSKLSMADAIEILHPDTTAKKLIEIEYYHGFNGQKAKIEAVNEACLIACEAMQKQIPVEHHHTVVNTITPDDLDNGDNKIRVSICPCCLGAIMTVENEYPRYCTWCGQAIDWSR